MPKEKEPSTVVRDALIGAVMAQIVQLVFLSVSNYSINSTDLGQWAPYILTGFVSTTVGVILYLIFRRREGVRSSNRRFAISLGGSSHPALLMATSQIEKFGVNWDIEIGWNDDSLLAQMNRTSKVRAYADGPYCPHDHCRLTAFTKPTLLGGKKHCWRCAKCDMIFERPKDAYGIEDDEVEKVAMVEYEEWVKENPE